MDPRLLQEASEREAVSKPAFAALTIALLCAAGAVGCHLTAEDLRTHEMDAQSYETGRLWCVGLASAFSLGFTALVVHGWHGTSRNRVKHGRGSRSGRRRRSSRRGATADLAS